MDETPTPNSEPDFHTPPDIPSPSESSPNDGVPWTLPYVAVGIVAVILAAAVLLVVHALYENAVGEIRPAISLVALGAVLGAVQLAVSYGLGPLNFQVPISSLGLRLDTGKVPTHLVYTALAFGGSIGFIAAYTAFLDAAGLDSLQPDQGITEEAILGGGGLALSVLMVVVVGPFAEEVFFRGFIFAALRQRLGLIWALAVGGAIFAVFHVEPTIMLPIFVTGVLLAWLYHKTGTIWPPLVAHALQNALALAVSL